MCAEVTKGELNRPKQFLSDLCSIQPTKAEASIRVEAIIDEVQAAHLGSIDELISLLQSDLDEVRRATDLRFEVQDIAAKALRLRIDKLDIEKSTSTPSPYDTSGSL
jgi:hypothetical protein